MVDLDTGRREVLVMVLGKKGGGWGLGMRIGDGGWRIGDGGWRIGDGGW